VVADALSRKSIPPTVDCLIADFERMGISYCFAGVAQEETQLILQSSIPERVREEQQSDRLLQRVRECILQGRTGEFTIDGTGAIRFHGRLCVPQNS